MKGQLSRRRKKPDDCVSLVKQKKPTYEKVGVRKQQRGEEETFAGDGGRAGAQAMCF